MQWLLIGGTRFTGRALSEQLLARGHTLTLFHRGKTGADLFPEAEHLQGDRTEDLSPLAGRRFDAVVDFCGYFPKHVRQSAALLRDSRWYGYISSISAYADPIAAGTTAFDPVREPFAVEPDVVDGDTYGGLKVGCERAVSEVFGDRAALIRPGFIVGPHDPTDRFPSLLRTGAAGGTRILPGKPDEPLQFVDARDLAALIVRLGEAAVGGPVLGVHPAGTTTFAEVARFAAQEAGVDTRFVHIDGPELVERLDEDTRNTAFPLYDPENDGAHRLDPKRALALGATHRPVRDTVRDTLRYEATLERPSGQRHGLTAEQETSLLSALGA